MLYVTQYDACAMIASGLLFFIYTMRRSYESKSNRFFSILIILVFLTSLFDYVSCFTISYPDRYPLFLNYVMSLGYLFFFNLISIMYLIYIDSRAKLPEMKKPIYRIALIVFVLETIAIWSSPLTHLVAYFDENTAYRHGPVMAVLYVISFIFFVLEIYLFVAAHKRFTKYQLIASIFLIFSMAFGVIIQLFMPHFLICTFLMSLTLYFIYIVFENPAYYTYRDTQCLNRRAFQYELKKRVSESSDFCILGFRIHDFVYVTQNLRTSQVNDLCSQVCNRLQDTFYSNAFHMSDTEYVILVKKEDDLPKTADKLNLLFRKPIELKDSTPIQLHIVPCAITDIPSSASRSALEEMILFRIQHPNDERTSEEMIRTSLEERHNSRQLIHIVEEAVAKHSFTVYYQPIYHVQTGRFESAEALMRLYHDTLGFINPEKIVEIAEYHGMINAIGDMIFQKVCAFLQSIDCDELGLKYTEVNLSSLQLEENGLADAFQLIMQQYMVRPDQINLEITESSDLSDDTTMITNITKLSELGSGFSIDDYGSGFASASYLFRLPVELVKIDKSILWQAMENENAMAVLKHTIMMLKDLGKKIVVEGVETQEMVDLMTEYGVDYLQGYFFSKPIPENEFVEFLKEHNN